jgi:hypothetical protein
MTTYNIVNPAAMQAGQPEDISIVLANLQTIAAIINGSLDDANLSPAAAIAASKLAGYPNDPLKVLIGDGSWGSPAGSAGYGTVLPATPADGREYILVDSLTNPTYAWRFRYNAGSSSPYKWEFIGGTEANAYISPDQTLTTTGAWTDLATVGPSFVVPRAGDYDISISAAGYNSAANIQSYIGAGIGAWTTPGLAIVQVSRIAAQLDTAYFGSVRLAALASGAEIRMRYYLVAASTVHYSARRLTVVPVRVG